VCLCRCVLFCSSLACICAYAYIWKCKFHCRSAVRFSGESADHLITAHHGEKYILAKSHILPSPADSPTSDLLLLLPYTTVPSQSPNHTLPPHVRTLSPFTQDFQILTEDTRRQRATNVTILQLHKGGGTNQPLDQRTVVLLNSVYQLLNYVINELLKKIRTSWHLKVGKEREIMLERTKRKISFDLLCRQGRCVSINMQKVHFI